MKIDIRRLFILLSLIIIGIDFSSSIHSYINPELKEYMTMWEKETKIKPILRKVEFAKLDKEIAGICYFFTRTVLLDKDYWETLNVFQKKTLLYHELGHCVLYKMHNNEILKDGCPKSLMLERMFSSDQMSCYINRQDYYLQELIEK